jgi:hypothetical protein
MAGQWSAENMRALGSRHAQLEAERDLDGVMATLVADPVYEFWPIGLRARGQDSIRRYYEHLLEVFIPTQRGYRLVEEWLSERSLAQEYAIEINGPDGPETHQVIGILWAEGELMGGERVWGSEACLRAMIGPLFDELEPIHPRDRAA